MSIFGSILVCTLHLLQHSPTSEVTKNLKIQKLDTFKNFIDFDLLRKGSVQEIKTVSLFFLSIFATNFDVTF